MNLRGACFCDAAVPYRTRDCFTPNSIGIRKIIITCLLGTIKICKPFQLLHFSMIDGTLFCYTDYVNFVPLF